MKCSIRMRITKCQDLESVSAVVIVSVVFEVVTSAEVLAAVTGSVSFLEICVTFETFCSKLSAVTGDGTSAVWPGESQFWSFCTESWADEAKFWLSDNCDGGRAFAASLKIVTNWHGLGAWAYVSHDFLCERKREFSVDVITCCHRAAVCSSQHICHTQAVWSQCTQVLADAPTSHKQGSRNSACNPPYCATARNSVRIYVSLWPLYKNINSVMIGWLIFTNSMLIGHLHGTIGGGGSRRAMLL